ncbi:MAG TPA: hypothetical protein VE861_14165 [Gemmatimonadaceae bacterium]|nr:hypothetical protein [Gemmatimonadaceae bacterium]
MTESAPIDDAAAAARGGDAAAASSRAARELLDAALAHTIATLAHDLRNALGVVSMQVEVIAVRAAAAAPDVAGIAANASVAAEHIERLADMTNAMIAFAKGRTSSDLSVIIAEAAALVPLRQISVSRVAGATVDVDPVLTRAVALEVLILTLDQRAAPEFLITTDPGGSTLRVVAGVPLVADEALEWVVQFRNAGGRIDSTEDGLRLQFPPIA